MKELMTKVTVAEYPTFRQQVIERCKWTRTQYNDRYAGRVKLSALETEIVQGVINQLINNRQNQ